MPTLARLELPRPAAAGADGDHVGGAVAPLLPPAAEVYAALVTGLRDYVRKNGFRRVVLGLSGGIDSALVAASPPTRSAPTASAVVMPSPYSSAETQDDARTLAGNLGVELFELPIEPAMQAYEARSPTRSTAPSPASPRRTCRRASAATS